MAAYTWVGVTSTDYGTGTNWTSVGGPANSVPTLTDTITFSGSVNCNLGSVRTVQGLTFSGYTGTLQLTGNLIVNGNVTLQPTAINTSGTNALIVGASSTFNPNGGNWSGNLQLGNLTSIVVTLISGFSISGTLTFASTVSLTGAFFVRALGDVVASLNCIVSTTISNSTTLVLAGATTKWSGSGRLGCNITFDSASSNFFIEGNVVFGSIVLGSASPQLNFTSGTSTTTTGSTLTLVGSVQLSVQQIVFNNVNLGTLALNQLFTISLIQDLVIGGNLVVGFGGNGQHQIARSSTQRIFVRGNLQVGFNGFVNSINAEGTTGGEIVMQGNASTTSTMSSFFNGALQGGKCWCNIDVTIDAGANSVVLSTTNDFNFGNPVASALRPRRFKYTSGNFSAAGSTINLANSILDFDDAQVRRLNNVRIYSSTLVGAVNVQLQKNTTITGNLITGFSAVAAFGGGASTLSQSSGSTATALNIQGGILLASNVFTFEGPNPLNSPIISLNFIGSGTIEGNSMCNADINLSGTSYTINNFVYGNQAAVPTNVPILSIIRDQLLVRELFIPPM
jgi:hypothetical protein